MIFFRLYDVNLTTLSLHAHLQPLQFILYTNKGKVTPLQAWTCTEDSRRLTFPDFKTVSPSAHEDGKVVNPRDRPHYGTGAMKNPNDPIGSRTRDLPPCSTVPQPTAPPHDPLYILLCYRICNCFSIPLQLQM
jgi:hypothetical protein